MCLASETAAIRRHFRSAAMTLRTCCSATRALVGYLGEADMIHTDFDDFAAEAHPRLRRALIATRGVDGAADAAAEALAYAWEHWDRIRVMDRPLGYLFRVGQSKTRSRRQACLPPPEILGVPDLEPKLVPALQSLPEQQRTVIWLVHACQWTHAEVAEALDITASSVATHGSRALMKLRSLLEVDCSA